MVNGLRTRTADPCNVKRLFFVSVNVKAMFVRCFEADDPVWLCSQHHSCLGGIKNVLQCCKT